MFLKSLDATTATFQTGAPAAELPAELAVEIAQNGGPAAPENSPAPKPRTLDPRAAFDARTRAAMDPSVLQLMQRTEQQPGVKPRAVPPGNNPPPSFPGGLGQPFPQNPFPGLGQPSQNPMAAPPAGGKGGLFAKESKETAAAALKAEGQIDPASPYAVERGDQRRRFDQLGLPRTGKNRIYIQDLGAEHAAMITRTVGGQTALAQGADIRTDAPKTNPTAAKGDGERLSWAKANPTLGANDLVQREAGNLIGSVEDMTGPIVAATVASVKENDGRKTFMTMSWGQSPEGTANQLARTMLLSEPGTKLYEDTVAALGRAPKVTQEGDRTRLERADLETVKQKLVYPALDREMNTPEFKQDMATARANLEKSLGDARKAGIMVFQAANNDTEWATSAGRPDMAISTTSGIKGLFRVGATNPNGAGTADDTMAGFSGEGVVTASATGMNIPVGVKDGKAFNVEGTSFASPLMAETAYLVSNANPKLSIDQIQRVLTDPRVARDISGTTRDGAGVVDPFAAAMVAKYPRITSAQIDAARTALDGDPNAKFNILADGSVRRR